jgi:Cu2+-exporting ATPase
MPFLLLKLLILGTSIYTGRHIYQENRTLKKQHFSLNPTQKTNPLLKEDESISSPTAGKNVNNKSLNQTDSELDEKKINQNLIISSVSLGIATVGALLSPLLSLLCIPALVWVGFPFFYNGYKSLKARRVNISIIDALFMTGVIVTGNYFAGSLGIFFFSFTRKILHKTEDHSKQNLLNLFGVKCHSVWVLKGDIEIEVPFDKLKKGDIIVLNAGETIPVDGTIVAGIASVDQHILTGESQPTEKDVGDPVFASTVILSGQINVAVEKAGSETVTAKISEVLIRTADFKKSIQSRGERIADQSSLPTLVMSGVTLPILGTTSAVTVSNACFGFYIRILGPLSMLTYLNLASKSGILIKDGRSLDILKDVDTIVFDKTGTLTLEQPHLGNIYTCNGFSENELLTLAATAEYRQLHPIAKAILQAAKERDLKLSEIREAKYEVSYGIKVDVFDSKDANAISRTIRVGSVRFMEKEGVTIPTEIRAIHADGDEQGYSFVYVAVEEQLGGILELHATVRPEAKGIISQFRQRGISTYIISGDHEQPTKKLAKELGVDDYFAETLPENKAILIEQLQNQGKFVCFVGDGINDSLALKKANVSISLEGASTIATDTAQIVLMDKTLNKLVHVFDIAYRFDSSMKTNTLATILPGIITVTGVLFFNFTIIHSMILNETGLLVGGINSMLPMINSNLSSYSLPPSYRRSDEKNP